MLVCDPWPSIIDDRDFRDRFQLSEARKNEGFGLSHSASPPQRLGARRRAVAAVLRAGGNAVDAAVATVMALSVVEPMMSGPRRDGWALAW